jgi:hypothetical protein
MTEEGSLYRPASESSLGSRALSLLARVAVALAVIAIFPVGPIVLHCGQQRHNVLGFDIVASYPAERKLVGGEAYASTLAALVEHELDGTTGWRPNDLFLWGPGLWADNNANRQLGIIQAARESARVLRDHLTKVSATEYDANLVSADTMLRNDERKFWFPSAESRFREGVRGLRKYQTGLEAVPPTSKPLNRRNIELIRLFQVWSDLLGDAHANLLRDDASLLESDDYYYHAQGFAHVMHHLTLAVKREYAADLAGRTAVLEFFDRVADSLGRAALAKPLVVLDGGPAGLLANHRRNLDAYIVDARQLMYSIREELEK